MFSKNLAMAFVATTAIVGASAYAADPPNAGPQANQKAAVADFGKLSRDGAQAYQDVTLTRLAIFDGRVDDAKKYLAQAKAEFNKAKTDDSVFTKSEADLRSHAAKPAKDQTAASADASANAASSDTKQPGAAPSSTGNQDTAKPIAWLPVDGTVTLAEDYALQPAKAQAVAAAIKSLAKGDRDGAMEKLKLADVNLNVVTAVVPLKAMLTDVQDAAQMISAGKYYEGSQKLRALQAGMIVVASDTAMVPNAKAKAANGSAKGNAQQAPAGKAPAPATH